MSLGLLHLALLLEISLSRSLYLSHSSACVLAVVVLSRSRVNLDDAEGTSSSESDGEPDLEEVSPPPSVPPEKNLRHPRWSKIPHTDIEWVCGACTLHNKLANTKCDVCGAAFDKFSCYSSRVTATRPETGTTDPAPRR